MPDYQNVYERVFPRNENHAVVCPHCGSEWFFQIQVNQYNADSYGSIPGSELETINQSSQALRMCLCGEVLPPNLSGVRGRTVGSEVDSMMKSLEKALSKRQEVAPMHEGPSDLTKLTEAVASREEVEALRKSVQELHEALRQMQKTPDVPMVLPPAPPAAPPKDQKKDDKKNEKKNAPRPSSEDGMSDLFNEDSVRQGR